ncbi:hypothetical protein QBC46DRAFT_397646 [Diplogelasinospora grovesii]|uniref:Uncharacterized protein n=1 Tax=Diplogelasinospora grovesii TaxID=303347 RepID=A0AAN6N0R6_9PEZI|nr:hypothetical protein QBC46DRAFT_397646 [Diplogelasinospora grovesii]
MGRSRSPPDPVVDNLKPALPYTAGALLKVQQHIPPPPYGSSGYRRPFPRTHMRDYQRYGTPSLCCLANPPTETPPHPYPKMWTLIIDDQIACSDGRGAQVVTCHFEGREAIQLVAKIFDPLYYNWNGDFDITYVADEEYACEAAAFQRLRDIKDADRMGYPGVQEALEGSIPTYHQSWTWETRLLDGQCRDVRLILMSYIPYPSMKSIIESGKARTIPAETRMRLLARALEIYCWLRYFGVDQHEFRNAQYHGRPRAGASRASRFRPLKGPRSTQLLVDLVR